MIGGKLEKKSRFSEEEIEAFAKRLKRFYEMFGKDFRRGGDVKG
ncbi:hypothetical protein [Thermococcus indicus]|nr:hypothetical protein [Thermococcus indicus]